MNRLLKILGLAVGAVVLLLVVVAVAVSVLFDPNDYKDEITAAVQDATGRQLTLDGDLELALFPTIRIAVGSATLSATRRDSATSRWHASAAPSCESRLLPLLVAAHRGQPGPARGSRAEPRAQPQRRQQLAGPERRRHAGRRCAGRRMAATARPRDLDLGVGAIEIEDARIVWNDASTGSRWELTDFGLTAEDFGVGERFPLHMEFGLAGADVAVQVAADMQATLTLADNEYRLDELAVTVDGSGAGWPGGPSQASAELRLAGRESRRRDARAERAHAGVPRHHDGRLAVGAAAAQRSCADGRRRHPRVRAARGARAVRSRRADGRRRCADARQREGELCSTTRARSGCATCSSRSTTRR